MIIHLNQQKNDFRRWKASWKITKFNSYLKTYSTTFDAKYSPRQSIEKYVSSPYEINIFESTKLIVRQSMQLNQQDEQMHV